MPNVTRGEDLPDLVRYLFGPGRSNEHTNQRLIASSEGLAAEGQPRFSEPGQLQELGRELDAPKTLFGTEVRDGYVWHCSISLPPEDGTLSDAQWAAVAHRMAGAMGFTEKAGRAPCRWIAVHHGRSTGGNDHIHLAVNLVREDGTKANVWRDHPRSQRVCADLERELGLRVVEGRGGRSVPGIKRGEREADARRGRPEPARRTLARRVRAAATAAGDEAEFVRLLRRSGVIARPRYGKGGRREVVGYSVALQPGKDGTMVWYPGGKLAGDLTLTRLREMWPGSDAAAAVEVWSSSKARAQSPQGPWRHDPTVWEAAAQQVAEVRERLAAVPPDDIEQWARTASEAAGVLAAWSSRVEENRPGPLARAADVLARSAQRPYGHRPRQAPAQQSQHLRGVAMVVMFGVTGAHSSLGQMLVVRQVRNTMRALHDMHRARGERDQAARLADEARGGLAQVEAAREAMALSPGAVPQPGPDLGPEYPAVQEDRDAGLDR